MYEGFYSLTNTPFTRGIPEDCLFFPPEHLSGNRPERAWDRSETE